MGHRLNGLLWIKTDLYSGESNKNTADSQIFFKELTKKICESAVLFFTGANLFDPFQSVAKLRAKKGILRDT